MAYPPNYGSGYPQAPPPPGINYPPQGHMHQPYPGPPPQGPPYGAPYGGPPPTIYQPGYYPPQQPQTVIVEERRDRSNDALKDCMICALCTSLCCFCCCDD